MQIEVNGELTDFDNGLNIKDLVSSLVDNYQGMAVALNNSVISKSEWNQTYLKQNDKVLLIMATQGG